MDINVKLLEQYVNDGLVYKRKHPILDLWIYNYTPIVQYQRIWDDLTMMCRGLVLDEKYNIIARPFTKFFNYNEGVIQNELNYHLQKDTQYCIQEKVDGSLCIVFYYNGEWIISTRGSFESTMSIKGKELLNKLQLDKIPTDIKNNYTFLFEIIYPENRIVIDYGIDEKLVLLSMVNTITGYEIFYEKLKYYADLINVECVQFLDSSYTDIIELLKEPSFLNKEGYVITFFQNDINAPENCIKSFRVKCKYDKYIQYHKLIMSFTIHTVWEYLSTNNDLLPNIPDEFYSAFDTIKSKLLEQYNELLKYTIAECNRINSMNYKCAKDIAEDVKQCKYPSLLFAYIQNKDSILEQNIWKIIEPKNLTYVSLNI